MFRYYIGDETSYLKAIKKFNESDCQIISSMLADWMTQSIFGQRIARNVESEHFLPEDNMFEILSFILNYHTKNNNNPISWEDFEKEYTQLCHKHTLKGGAIGIEPKPRFLGAAIEYEILSVHLQRNYPDLGLYIEDIILSLLYIDKISDDRKRIRLKAYSIWSTWDVEHPDKNYPFDYCNTENADEVRANMGLRREDAKGELLLFYYTVPVNIELCRPTIADAECSQYFEPPVPAFKDHGWTVTWQTDKKTTGFNMKPRPECIHDSITLGDVIFPIIIRL